MAQTAPTLPATALQQINELLAEKEGRSPAQRKISSGLLHAARAQKGLPLTANVKALALSVPIRADGRVDVEVVGELTKATIERVQQAGGEVIGAELGSKVMRAAVPLDRLEEIAALGEVRAIHPAMRATTHAMLARRTERLRSTLLTALDRPVLPSRALFTPLLQQGVGLSPVANAGSVSSQGSRAHGADRARNWFGVDGTGVKIGVLSDSDDFKESSIASGDLPADTVTVPGQSGRPGAGEGTAMMEIVHDVAPGAQLFFATAFNSPESFAENIRTLRFTYHCDVIVDDIIYYFESPYQDDIIARAVKDVVADGASYFSSAGNEGNLDDGTSGVWEGDFKKAKVASTVLPSGYEVHDFGRGVTANRITVGGGPLILHWADPGSLDHPLASQDYDIFVLTPDLRSVAVASTDIQDGDDLPFEFLGFNIPAGYQVVVARKVGAADRAIRVQLFAGGLALATDGANYGHSAVEEAFAVAAVDVAQAGGGEFTGGATTQVELYSADGPRQIFYDPDGHLIADGPTFLRGGGELRKKPDLTAADGVSTTLPSGSGLNPFFGTSAAAPHAAAIAGLFISGKPTITQAKLRSALTKSAIDIEAPGRDRDSGFGIVSAFAGLTFLNVTPQPFITLGTVTTTPSPGTFLAPGGSASMAVQLFNGGGATAKNLHGTLTTSTPGFNITSGTAAWVDIAAGASGTNTTPFTMSVDPTVTCGVAAALNLTTTFTAASSPKTFSFKVQTGKPSTTSVINPYAGAPVAIPDANPAGVNIPFTLSGVGAMSLVEFSFDGATCNTTIGSTTVGLAHTWVGDLVVTLTSPSGTKVTLMSRPGGTGNSANNFCQTLLSDSATNSIQAVTIAQAPYTGSFKPASPLAAFAGENGDGTWILNVSDLAATDTGLVRAFSIRTRGFSCQ
jgi:subtilisin-like proprotein convertase family protein